jgi:hypothetical protein
MPDGSRDADARASHCWFSIDRVPRDPRSTEWKRGARLRQARWREARGYPIGSHPYGGGAGATPVGSRLDLPFARSSGANFITEGALVAVRARLAAPEKHQTLMEDRLWADLLSSMPLCFNLFGDLAGDGSAARRAVEAWWPDAPNGAVSVRFEHSPGRREPVFLGNRSAFDVAFDLDTGDGTRGIVGVETKYHEHAVAEAPPKAAALTRYGQVTDRSGIFREGWRARLIGTDLQQIWLDHLLLLAMLQHSSQRWAWGKFVLAYPVGNRSFAAAVARYAEVLADASTFDARTIEDLLATPDALRPKHIEVFRDRYFSHHGHESSGGTS